MKILWIAFLFLFPGLALAQSAAEILQRLSQNEIRAEKPQILFPGKVFLEPQVKFDFGKIPSSQNILERYVKMGGDVSGGGFGLKIKGTDKVILHDLWCGNKNYVYEEHARISADGQAELNVALARLEIWKSAAPALIAEVEKILREPRHWKLTLEKLALNPVEHFEFPGTPEELVEFHKTYEEIQAAQVNRHTEVISLSAPIWNRMDLQSRAGLLIHEALRLIYIRSVKGYMVPGILQWMTGVIMNNTPDFPMTARLLESFYEELIITLDNTAAADHQRPEAWRSQLCKQRLELVRNVKTILPKARFIKSESAETSLKNLCALQEQAVSLHRSRTPWMNLGFTVEDLKSPCHAKNMSEVANYTLTYWMQKNLGLGLTWETPTHPQTSFDIVHLVKNSKSTLTTANYEALMKKFLERGDKYCLKRDDYYGSGEEFLALGDVLLETLVKASKVK